MMREEAMVDRRTDTRHKEIKGGKDFNESCLSLAKEKGIATESTWKLEQVFCTTQQQHE